MPIYDYECQTCGMIKEMICKVEDEVTCPRCLSGMDRVFTKVPLLSYSNRPNERPWGTSHWRSQRKEKR